MFPNQEKTLWLVRELEERQDGVSPALLVHALVTTPDCVERICQTLQAKGYLEETRSAENSRYRLTEEGRKVLRELLVRGAESLEHLPAEFIQRQEQIEAELVTQKADSRQGKA